MCTASGLRLGGPGSKHALSGTGAFPSGESVQPPWRSQRVLKPEMVNNTTQVSRSASEVPPLLSIPPLRRKHAHERKRSNFSVPSPDMRTHRPHCVVAATAANNDIGCVLMTAPRPRPVGPFSCFSPYERFTTAAPMRLQHRELTRGKRRNIQRQAGCCPSPTGGASPFLPALPSPPPLQRNQNSLDVTRAD